MKGGIIEALEILTPIKAIRMKCLECCNWSRAEVKACGIPDCAIWPYRLGRRPTDADIETVKNTIDPLAGQKLQAGIGGKDGRAGNGQNLAEYRSGL